jgi:cell wall integrity and stress response component
MVKTVTVTPTAPPTGDNSTKKSASNGLSTGGIVGLVIGLVALVAIVAALLFFWLRRRRQSEADEKPPSRGGSSLGMGGQVPSRTMSENSRYVLGTDGRQVVETWEASSDTPGSRRSRLMPVDPRLDPFAPVYQRGEGNKSRESVNTIRDDHDYSRRVHQKGPILRATNPDD